MDKVGADTLNGDDGDDFLNGGTGIDQMSGGAGDDDILLIMKMTS